MPAAFWLDRPPPGLSSTRTDSTLVFHPSPAIPMPLLGVAAIRPATAVPWPSGSGVLSGWQGAAGSFSAAAVEQGEVGPTMTLPAGSGWGAAAAGSATATRLVGAAWGAVPAA